MSSPADPADPLIGALLHGKYRLVRRIGSGGFGTVYEASDERGAGNRVAVKVLNKEFSSDARLVRAFRAEARRMTRLSHPNIVDWKNFDADEKGTCYFVMELVEGEELDRVLERDRPLPPERVARILLQILDALRTAHHLAEGGSVLHLDLKPRNVFIVPARPGRPEQVRVIDFGIGQHIGEEAEDEPALPRGSGRPGTSFVPAFSPSTLHFQESTVNLVSANLGSNTLTVFFQTRPGVFGTTPLSLGNASVTNGPISVAPADIDGDGDLDLVSANQNSDTLTVFFQTSPGVFGTTPLSIGNASVTNDPQSVAPADLDGDGDLDLASANSGSNTLTVFVQESTGVFGSTPLSIGNASVTNRPLSVTAADLDGDGDLDLASANLGSRTLTVFFQESPGVFGSTPLSLGNASVTNGPVSITAADLDGDGDLDLASANNFNHTLTVFWNNH